MTVSDWRRWTRTMEGRGYGWEMELWVLLLYKGRRWWWIRSRGCYRGRGTHTMRVVMGVVVIVGFFFMFG